MSRLYTTEDLIEILETERQACITGDRLNLAATISGNPLIDQFLQPEGVQKFTAYQDFRAMVHEYQRSQGVSGVVWRSILHQCKTLTYPEIHDQLVALPADLDLLRQFQPEVWRFWQGIVAGMDLYLSVSHGKNFQAIEIPGVQNLVDRTEWATLQKQEGRNYLELILQLGWGKPEEAHYKRGWPTSGSEYIHAVLPGTRPIP